MELYSLDGRKLTKAQFRRAIDIANSPFSSDLGWYNKKKGRYTRAGWDVIYNKRKY